MWSWRCRIARIVLQLFHIVLCIFGLSTVVRLRLLQPLLFCCWFCWLAFASVRCFRWLAWGVNACSLGCWVGLALFLTQITAHMAILLETSLRQQAMQALRQRHRSLSESFAPGGGHVRCTCSKALLVAGQLANIALVHGVIAWSSSRQPEEQATVLYWHSLPSALALELRLISFLAQVLDANGKAHNVSCQLQILAQQLPSRWRYAVQVEKQIVQLASFKLRYIELHNLFELLNSCFGTTLLAGCIVFFVDFVCNSYRIVGSLLTAAYNAHALLQNAGFVLIVVVQFCTVCWYCQCSSNHSRQIGCLVSKLVKPIGNKRYNDLVSDFSLQTLHQRFVVTAMDFFSLNLHLLSSMFAAVVTYLVILIQFLFAERSSKAKAGTAQPDEATVSWKKSEFN